MARLAADILLNHQKPTELAHEDNCQRRSA
jgi:hypothetical protein